MLQPKKHMQVWDCRGRPFPLGGVHNSIPGLLQQLRSCDTTVQSYVTCMLPMIQYEAYTVHGALHWQRQIANDGPNMMTAV
jgi:hypothetical protein